MERLHKKSLLSITEDYVVNIEYNSRFNKIDEIVWDKGEYTAFQLLKNCRTDELCIVTKNGDSLLRGMNEAFENYSDFVEGFSQICWETKTYSDYTILDVKVMYSVDKMQMQSIKKQTVFEIKRIISEMKNVSKIPLFLKVFLAFSYVTQNCSLNRAAQNEKLGIGQKTNYPNASMAYGVINEHCASSKGIAWMLKYLLDEMQIENRIISGKISDNYLETDDYYWNLVALDGQYYHVDATWHIDMDGIFVGGFMKDDNYMLQTHAWYDRYPAAKGTRFDYDFVEDYLIENGEDLLDSGIPDYLLFPEPVNDF